MENIKNIEIIKIFDLLLDKLEKNTINQNLICEFQMLRELIESRFISRLISK